jgi:fatty acid desaturase
MQLAVSEMSDGSFNGYMVALTISGLILLALAIGGFFKASKGSRIFSGVVGLAFLGYAFYLFFIFTGGAVFVSYYVFIVPVILIVNLFRSRKEKQQQAEVQVAAPMGQPPAPPTPTA